MNALHVELYVLANAPDPGIGFFLLFCGLPVLVGIVVAGGLTAIVFSEIRRRRTIARERDGLCIRCGYDLRGGGDECPECGFPVGRPKAKPM